MLTPRHTIPGPRRLGRAALGPPAGRAAAPGAAQRETRAALPHAARRRAVDKNRFLRMMMYYLI